MIDTETNLRLSPRRPLEKCRTILSCDLLASDRHRWFGWKLLQVSLLGLLLNGWTTQIQAEGSFPVFTEFQEVKDLYEPSAAEQLPDGRIFVVEDEVAHSLAILTIQEDGTFDVERLDPESFLETVSEDGIPEDFEGIAVDNDGYVYITTSHSRETDGIAYPHREKLIRFKMDGNEPVDMTVYGNLLTDLSSYHIYLEDSAAILNVKDEGGLNIEGIAFSSDKEKLLVGLRSPQYEGEAIILTIENVKEIFEQGAKAIIAEEAVLLDLDGGGVRGIAYIPKLNGYLIISGPSNRDRSINWGLWFWSGESEDEAVQVTIPGPAGTINLTECVSPIQFGGNDRILLVKDDGKKKKKGARNAHYIFLKYDQLEFEGN
jgi:hypothetical protein